METFALIFQIKREGEKEDAQSAADRPDASEAGAL